MRLLTLFLFFWVLSVPARGAEWVDPFVNPIKLQEKKLEKLKKLKEQLAKEKKEVHLFRPAIPKPLDQLSIQGVISGKNGYILVVLDPETGETYMLKAGDAISPAEKIVKITPEKIVIVRFVYKNGKLRKVYRTVKVNLEG